MWCSYEEKCANWFEGKSEITLLFTHLLIWWDLRWFMKKWHICPLIFIKYHEGKNVSLAASDCQALICCWLPLPPPASGGDRDRWAGRGGVPRRHWRLHAVRGSEAEQPTEQGDKLMQGEALSQAERVAMVTGCRVVAEELAQGVCCLFVTYKRGLSGYKICVSGSSFSNIFNWKRIRIQT